MNAVTAAPRSAELLEQLSARMSTLLQERGALSSVQMEYARQKQRVEAKPLWHVLIDNGLARERDVCEALAALLGCDFVRTEQIGPPDAAVLALFSQDMCMAAQFLPLRREGPGLVLLLGDTWPADVAQLVLRRCGLRCRFVVGEFSRVRALIRDCFVFAQHPVAHLVDQEIRQLALDQEGTRSPATFLDHLLHLAVQERATDIHVVPGPASAHVLFRVDGVLHPAYALPTGLMRMVSYVKLLAEMDISEKRRPQDGSFRARIADVPYSIRLSTIVTDLGERLVMRLLPESHDLKGLVELGFYEEDAQRIGAAMQAPSGLVVITGPTGSGKSSTLHAGLRMQRLIERNVLTVEDPIEYRVPVAGQTEVNRKAGYDFHVALRHFLRHDPDVMLVGEMRDAETVAAALDAATTGHLVLSTLHVTTAIGVLSRLNLLGARPQVLAENLLMVVNQRLVRRNCPACSVPLPFTAHQSEWLGLPHGSAGMHGPGCPLCRGTGFFGRVPVYEMLTVSQPLADLIATDAPRSALRAAAQAGGFQTIDTSAKRRIAEGVTTCEEVERAMGIGP
ncbi:GspE/PulE family protein [Pseudacidovorax sp.]|uniref:GspE/PulE family protein n=1 Tax=Pseudacidovorax sp. TaxID=1934311 RepID=UPI0025D092AA|nr:GspE/PulE family protein [Pseudacidovorax sp.]